MPPSRDIAPIAEIADARSVVLVEGISDQRALETLAARRGRDLEAERVRIVSIGGAKNIAGFMQRYGPRGLDVRLAGICDAREAIDFQRGLERAGFGPVGRGDLGRLGFFVCVEDLEDELIRALGDPSVEAIIDSQGELAAYRTFLRQPAQRARSRRQHLRRFMGTRSGRKERYASLLVDALDLAAVPRPLDDVLTHV